MIYAYIRVSTDKQCCENQRHEIVNFASKNQFHIGHWTEEVISSKKSLPERKLGRLLSRLRKGDILITAEISRLGRNLFEVMTILHLCMQKNIEVWTIKDNYRLGADLQSKVLAFAFSLSAEIERELISQRTREALNRLKDSGCKLGRKSGSKNKSHILDGREGLVTELLEQGIPKVQIAKLLHVSVFTIYRFLSNSKVANL